jgi:hypothetical protein
VEVQTVLSEWPAGRDSNRDHGEFQTSIKLIHTNISDGARLLMLAPFVFAPAKPASPAEL